MKVLMFVSNPFTNDPRVYNEAKSLIGAGYEVTVIANDPAKENPPQTNWNGIDVIRVRPVLAPKLSFGAPLWRGLSLISWQWQAFRQTLSLKKVGSFNIIHCHDLDTLSIGIRLKRKFGLPLVYDAHEIYGYMATRSIPRPMANAFLLLEKRLVRNVDHIITVHEALRGYLARITDKPISIVMNCKPLQDTDYQPRQNNGSFTILYIGSLHQGRAIPMLIDAAAELVDVRCIIGGMGAPNYLLEIRRKCEASPNVEFIGKVPFEEVIPMTKNADAVFMMINPQDMNNRIGLGNKQFEAMVCGRPIICTKGTYSGELTEREDVGLSVEFNKDALKQAIIKLRDNPELREKLGRNALQAAITKYNWHKQEEILLELYKSIKPGPN